MPPKARGKGPTRIGNVAAPGRVIRRMTPPEKFQGEVCVQGKFSPPPADMGGGGEKASSEGAKGGSKGGEPTPAPCLSHPVQVHFIQRGRSQSCSVLLTTPGVEHRSRQKATRWKNFHTGGIRLDRPGAGDTGGTRSVHTTDQIRPCQVPVGRA